MGLTASSFYLSKVQIDAINQHFTSRKDDYLAANEDIGMLSIRVEFEWVPGLGRFVSAHFDGEVSGCEVEELGDNNSSFSARTDTQEGI